MTVVSLADLTDRQIADVVDSLRDAVERSEIAAEFLHSVERHTDAYKDEQDAAYLDKLADDIENGQRVVTNGQAMDIFDALTESVNNCDQLYGETEVEFLLGFTTMEANLSEAAESYRSTRAMIDAAFLTH